MKRTLTLFVVTAILFSAMSIPVYAASGGFVMRTVTTDLVKGAFVDDNAAEDELLEDVIELIVPEKPDAPTEDADEPSVTEEPGKELPAEPINAEESLVIEKADTLDISMSTEP